MRSLKSSGQQKRLKRFIVRQVEGNSMIPTLTPGQLVVGRYVSDLKPGDVVIVSHDGIEKIKRIERQQGNLLYLLGDNSKESIDSRVFGWVHESAIVAKVVWPKL
jgi:phage repressor protein C with HTH and peptisase S24 domain